MFTTNYDIDEELQNKAVLHKVSMECFEAYGFEVAINLIDTLFPKLNYPHEIFVDYLREEYETIEANNVRLERKDITYS